MMKAECCALTLFFVTSGCFAVLDLDAEPGDEEEQGGGGATTQEDGGAGAGAAPPLVTATTSAGGSNEGGSYECVDSSVVFAGDELITVDDADHNVLDLDDKVAIGAWVWPASAAGEQFVFSRLDDEIRKGFALLLRETEAGLIPELRVYVDGDLCGCSAGAVPLETWSHVAARFFLDNIESKDAAVWVNGERSCIVECGSDKFQRFPAKPVIGASLRGTGGFFHGRLDDVYVMSSDDGDAPPMLDGSDCLEDVALLLSFDEAIVEGGLADCSAGLSVTLGRDAFAGPDEPSWESCP